MKISQTMVTLLSYTACNLYAIVDSKKAERDKLTLILLLMNLRIVGANLNTPVTN